MLVQYSPFSYIIITCFFFFVNWLVCVLPLMYQTLLLANGATPENATRVNITSFHSI
jgi:hypothetical protein